VEGNRPTLILGTTGSGKSTRLGELARDLHKKGIPVVYFRFRSSREVAARQPDGVHHSPVQQGTSEAPTLTVAAQRFYQAVGYPERSSYWSHWWMNGFKLSREGAKLSVAPVAVKARFKDAISDLFAVCETLNEEHKAGTSSVISDKADASSVISDKAETSSVISDKADTNILANDKRPVVLADELHDLLKEPCHNEGGKDVFLHFGIEMTQSCTDQRACRVVLAASGVDLAEHLKKTPATGNRVVRYMQPDPPECDVRQRLVELKYDTAAVDAIIATCGTRVRLLYPFLESKVKDVAAALQPLKDQAEKELDELMARCNGKEAQKLLVDALDKLATSPAASVHVRTSFPKEAVESFPNQVLLRKFGGLATFQSEAVRQAWKRVRTLYSPL
jgi:hypothetical protein